MFDTDRYCFALDNLDRAKAIRAIHQALLQLQALANVADENSFDNAPAIEALTECMADARHIGFDPL
jgi:hypothetical protein